jgi:hypothetical protein
MATMTETGTEKRIDDLRVEMHRGFEDLDRQFEKVNSDVRGVRGELREEVQLLRTEMIEGFTELDRKFDAKFDSLNRTIIVLLGGSLSVVTGGLIAAAFHVIS